MTMLTIVYIHDDYKERKFPYPINPKLRGRTMHANIYSGTINTYYREWPSIEELGVGGLNIRIRHMGEGCSSTVWLLSTQSLT